jgi:hypothetical protein
MVKFDVDLRPAYFLMIIGAIGIIAICVYIIVKILLYFRKSSKKSETKTT